MNQPRLRSAKAKGLREPHELTRIIGWMFLLWAMYFFLVSFHSGNSMIGAYSGFVLAAVFWATSRYLKRRSIKS